MGRERRYVEQIRVLDRLGLIRLWEWIQAGLPIEGWATGKAFEYLILRAFELEQAEVIWPYSVGRSEQIDGALFVDGMSCLIEAKEHTSPIGLGPIARLRARLDQRPPGVIGLLFSVNGFTRAAIDTLQRLPTQNVLLWNGLDLTQALMSGMRAGLQAKWRKAVERASFDHRLTK